MLKTSLHPQYMTLSLWIRRFRLVSGLVIFAFIADHLANLSLSLWSPDTAEDWRPILMGGWTNPVGQTALALAALVHSGLGFYTIAVRRTLTMRIRDAVQIGLGLAVPPLLVNHAVSSIMVWRLVEDFNLNYQFVLSSFWIFHPLLAYQQLALLVIVWLHGVIGLYSWMVLHAWWRKVGGPILVALLAVPVLAILGFVQAGNVLLDRYAHDDAFKAAMDHSAAQALSVTAQLGSIQAKVLIVYGICTAIAIGIFLVRLMLNRREIAYVKYEDDRKVSGRRGLTILEVSQANRVPHANICHGRGRCGTCRVQILAGQKCLSSPDKAELLTLQAVHAPAGARLACQAKVIGAWVKVVRLVPVYADASAAQAPEEWVTNPIPAEEVMQ
ncbi:2Fe-2S iron-sulfur cluster-binding protein [Methylovirgula sp. 4M-Z18]|uniref:2Fe-2S iron-sulfur cluster-binding protein n=1 Tax=Methylovirgula sp. 4M-Z18 TaxID=2293567 RepID=UPI001314321D|nr:2Fe-2S iron-sulfur cluster-binding protein [Methylovirgula sp. 4M-Z18]